MTGKKILLAFLIFQGVLVILSGIEYTELKIDTIPGDKTENRAIPAGNPRQLRPAGLGLGYSLGLMADPSFPMLKVDYFLIPQLEVELNIGYKYSSAGGMAHLNRTESERLITPFTGILFGIERGTYILQIPAGFRLLHRKGMSASFSINELIYLEYRRFEILFSLSAGWNFSFW